MTEQSELAALRQALAQAVEQAAGAAELARLLTEYQRRLDEAAHAEAEALTRLREAEARATAIERKGIQLAKNLAEQRYQTAVANWKLASVQESRWTKLGDALHAKNPGAMAKTLRAPVRKPPAPKRSNYPPEPLALPPAEVRPVPPDPRAPQVSAPLADGFTVPKGPLVRPYLTVAGIVDRQTEALLRYECRLVTNFGPDNWAEMLDRHQPHLLLVESVRPGPRQGNGGRWLAALAGESRALRDLVAACRTRGITTVFWHSGGPVSRAVPAAEQVDYVLATSPARAREWRSALRHDRVGVLPHAIQPRVHNPIPPVGGRTAEVMTLGTVRLPSLSADPVTAGPSDAASDSTTNGTATGTANRTATGTDHSNNSAATSADQGNNGTANDCPALPGHSDDPASYDEVLTAYRRPALVVAGADADPRVIAEVAACGTPVLQVRGGAPAEEVAAAARSVLADPRRLAAEAHLAWRAGASVTPLLDPILDTIGLPSVRSAGTISAVCVVATPEELDHVLGQIARQLRRPGQLVVVADRLDPALVTKAAQRALRPEGAADDAADLDLVVRSTDEPVTCGAGLDRALRLADGDYVAVFDPRDLYGEHYLADLVRHFSSTDAEVLGKACFYAHLPRAGVTLLRQPGAEHRFLPEVAGGTVLARRQILTDLGLADLSDEWGEVLMRQCRADGIRVYSADRYSYVCVRPSAEGYLLRAARVEGNLPAEPLALI